MEGVGEAPCARATNVRAGARYKRPLLAATILGPLLLLACCLLKFVAHPETLVVKPRQSKPSSVIKPSTRTKLGSKCHRSTRDASTFRTIVLSLKRGSKRPFLDSTSAIERPGRLEITQSLLHVMQICSPVILSYVDAKSEAQ